MKALAILALIAAPAFAGDLPYHPEPIKPEAKSTAVASSESGGNTLSTVTEYPRQAPSVGQGSIVIGGCGSGGNAGGSNTHGSAFLGFAWTPKDCKLLLAANAYQALGMYDAACEMVNGVKAVRKQWAELGKSPPPCAVKPAEAPKSEPVTVNVTNTPVDTSAYATRQELQETVKRATERAAGK